MDTEQEALKLVDTVLLSIETAVTDWKKSNKKTQEMYQERITHLINWKGKLENWKHNFIEAEGPGRYFMLIELHTMVHHPS